MLARVLILLGLAVAACAPSPLYVGKPGTTGNVPRDARGEPILPPPPAPDVPRG